MNDKFLNKNVSPNIESEFDCILNYYKNTWVIEKNYLSDLEKSIICLIKKVKSWKKNKILNPLKHNKNMYIYYELKSKKNISSNKLLKKETNLSSNRLVKIDNDLIENKLIKTDKIKKKFKLFKKIYNIHKTSKLKSNEKFIVKKIYNKIKMKKLNKKSIKRKTKKNIKYFKLLNNISNKIQNIGINITNNKNVNITLINKKPKNRPKSLWSINKEVNLPKRAKFDKSTTLDSNMENKNNNENYINASILDFDLFLNNNNSKFNFNNNNLNNNEKYKKLHKIYQINSVKKNSQFKIKNILNLNRISWFNKKLNISENLIHANEFYPIQKIDNYIINTDFKNIFIYKIIINIDNISKKLISLQFVYNCDDRILYGYKHGQGDEQCNYNNSQINQEEITINKNDKLMDFYISYNSNIEFISFNTTLYLNYQFGKSEFKEKEKYFKKEYKFNDKKIFLQSFYNHNYNIKLIKIN